MTAPHVCILSCQHSPDDVRVTHKVGKSFRDAGFRVSWIGPSHPASLNAYGIEFHFYNRLPGRPGRLLHHLPAMRAAAALKAVDVYYAVEPDSAVVALGLARLRGGAVVFDIHEIFHDDTLAGWTSGLARQVAGGLVLRAMRSICRHADMVVAVSKTVLDSYVSKQVCSMVVHNFAPAGFASSAPAQVMPSGRPEVVVMQGWIGPHRGNEIVLLAAKEASERLQRRVRVIAFADPTESRSEISEMRDLARRLDAEDNLDLRLPISYAEMRAVLHTCDIGMLTYSRVLGVNGLPNRLFEYMAVGLPVIGPSYGIEVARIVENSGCGLLVDCEDPKEVSDALVRLVQQPEDARLMGANGRKAFSDHHNWEREIQPLIDWVTRMAMLGAPE